MVDIHILYFIVDSLYSLNLFIDLWLGFMQNFEHSIWIYVTCSIIISKCSFLHFPCIDGGESRFSNCLTQSVNPSVCLSVCSSICRKQFGYLVCLICNSNSFHSTFFKLCLLMTPFLDRFDYFFFQDFPCVELCDYCNRML